MKSSTATPLLPMPTAEVVETKETALVTIEPTTALAVFTDKEKADAILAKIKKIVAEFKGDVSTAKGRAEIASMAYKIARSKTYVEAERKKLADYHKELPKKIDATGKHFRDEFEKLQDEVRKPLTEWEEEEKARVQGIKDRIAHIKTPIPEDSSSEGIAHAIETIETEFEIDDTFDEFKAEAQAAKNATLAKLYQMRGAALKREAEAAELARLREEAAKRAQEDRDRKIAEAAAEKAKRDAEEAAARERADAERKAKEEREAAERRELELKLSAEKAARERLEAIEMAEREKVAAVEAERRKQEEAERIRIAKEVSNKVEAERRAADLAHREGIHSVIFERLKDNGIPATHAAAVVSLISTGSIPFVTVEY